MRVTWIGGWGVAPESLRPMAEQCFAKAEHTFLAPVPPALGTNAESPKDLGRTKIPAPNLCPPQIFGRSSSSAPDLTIAWSLGAWRVIEAASQGVQFPGMVLLFAPFVAFPSESQLGGKCSATQVKFLRRWLQREPLAALADFHQRAGISQPLTRPSGTLSPSDGERDGVRGAPANSALPYAMPDLLEGLDRLAEDAPPALQEFASRGLPRNWQALIGDDDPLLDGAAVCRSLPGCVLVRGAGHAIADLLAASQAK